MKKGRVNRRNVPLLAIVLVLPVTVGTQCQLPWLDSAPPEADRGPGTATYYQDIDIGGSDDPSVPFDGAVTYIEPSIGSNFVGVTTTLADPWYVGQSRYSTIGGETFEVQLRWGTDILGNKTRILRLISPYFNRFLVSVFQITGPTTSVKWSKLTNGPVENGAPIEDPYSDREKRFFGKVMISCYYVPGEELDYPDKFLPPLEAKYGETNVIDTWVATAPDPINPGTFRWSAGTDIITDDPTPVVIDSIPPGPYEIIYEGRHIYVRGNGSQNGIIVQVGDVKHIVSDTAPLSYWPPQWDMDMYKDAPNYMAAQLYFSWDDDAGIAAGGTYTLNQDVFFEGNLYDPETGKCFMFPYPLQSGLEEGEITFLQLGLFDGGTTVVFVEWSGEAIQADLPFCVGPPAAWTPSIGEPVPAVVYGMLITDNCCDWPPEED